ncbi:MAG TPA: hypothetical protein VGD80_32610 [Kofleriaceae bacterium]
MQWLVDRLCARVSRLRWMAVPLAVYLAITLGLPLANGAAVRSGFVHHAGWVVAGCAAIAISVLIGGIAIDIIRGILKLRHHLGGPS